MVTVVLEPFPTHLRRLMDEKRMNPRKLAEAAGVSPNTVGNWLRGAAEPSPATLRLVAAALGADADEMIRLAYAPRPVQPILVREVTQYVSAGPGNFLETELWSYVPAADEVGHTFIAVPVAGDCMEPRIRPGERVIVDTDASPKHGDIVVAIHDGEALVKMLERRGSATYLVALQKEAPVRMNGETQILGVVKSVQRKP